jgi:hypothetical protein
MEDHLPEDFSEERRLLEQQDDPQIHSFAGQYTCLCPNYHMRTVILKLCIRIHVLKRFFFLSESLRVAGLRADSQPTHQQGSEDATKGVQSSLIRKWDPLLKVPRLRLEDVDTVEELEGLVDMALLKDELTKLGMKVMIQQVGNAPSTHARTSACARKHIHTHPHARTRTHARTHAHTHTQ